MRLAQVKPKRTLHTSTFLGPKRVGWTRFALGSLKFWSRKPKLTVGLVWTQAVSSFWPPAPLLRALLPPARSSSLQHEAPTDSGALQQQQGVQAATIGQSTMATTGQIGGSCSRINPCWPIAQLAALTLRVPPAARQCPGRATRRRGLRGGARRPPLLHIPFI